MEKKQLDVGLLYAGGLCLEPLSMLTSPILSAEADLVSYMILQVYPSINPFSLTYPGLISRYEVLLSDKSSEMLLLFKPALVLSMLAHNQSSQEQAATHSSAILPLSI